jgi:hypothetical protein
MMQAFIWHHLVPVEDWTVIVSGKPGPKPPFDVLVNSPRMVLPQGGEVILPVRPVAKNVAPEELRVETDEPKGVSAAIVIDDWRGFAIKLKTDAGQVEPGLRGNLLLHAYREATPAPTESNPQPKPWRADLGIFPAIPFEIAGQKANR